MKFILKTLSSMTLLASPAGWNLFVHSLMRCQRYVCSVTVRPRSDVGSTLCPLSPTFSSSPALKYKNSVCYRTPLKRLPTYSLSIRTSHFSATPRPLRRSRLDYNFSSFRLTILIYSILRHSGCQCAPHSPA